MVRRRIRDLKEAGVDRMAFYDIVEPEGYDHFEQLSFNMAKAHANGWQLEWRGLRKEGRARLQPEARDRCAPVGLLAPRRLD